MTAAPFSKIEHELIDSEAYRALSCVARAVFVELCRCHNGRNNGEITAASRWLGERMGCSFQTAARALRELADLGFVRVAQPGGFSTKNQPARYELTCYPCGDKPATKDYLSARPELRTDRKMPEPVSPVRRPVSPVRRDSLTHETRGAYSLTHATGPVSPMRQSIDLPSREPTPSGPAVADAPPAGRPSAGRGAAEPSEPTPAGAETRSHLAGHFTSPPSPAEPPAGEPAGTADRPDHLALAVWDYGGDAG